MGLQLQDFRADWLAPTPYDPATLPEGWLTTLEARILFTAARIAKGPILEVGSWIGRSTCAMAYALRERVTAGEPLPRFDVIDFGLTGADEARERLQFEPLHGPHADHHAKALFYPGGVPGLLKQNLVDRDLARYVNHLIFGDLLTYEPATRYDVIFCDASHNELEIRRNVPKVAELSNRYDFLMVFDDVITGANASMIQEIVGADAGALTCGFDPASKTLVMARGRYVGLAGLV